MVRELDPDFFCVQETKLQAGQLDLTLPGYTSYWDYAEKKGYSGTMILAKKPPLSVSLGIGDEEHGHEGRCVTLEYPAFYMVTLYSPNSQDGLRRLPYRLSFEEALRRYLAGLDAKKPVILCGDLNVAHQEIDLKNPGPNRGMPGFPTRSGRRSDACSPPALPIPSACSTRIKPGHTAGGPIASTPGGTTRDGGSIIFSSATGWRRGWYGQILPPLFWVRPLSGPAGAGGLIWKIPAVEAARTPL